MKTLRQLEKEGLERRSQEGFLAGWRRMLLVVLLAVLGLFGYLYYFTDLILSHGEPRKEVKASVRKALPRKGSSASVRPALTAVTTARSAVKPVEPSPRGDQAIPAKPVKETKAVAMVGTPVTTPVVAEHKVSPPPPPQAVTAVVKKVPPEPPRRLVTLPRPVAAPSLPPVPAAGSPVKSPPRVVAAVAKQQQAVPPPKPADSPPLAAVTDKERFAVRCGPFITDRELIPARLLLKKAGLEPVTSRGPKRSTRMYRLLVAEYKDADLAAAERKKMLEEAPDAFILPHGGVYELIAGSYHEEEGGNRELERLSTWGISARLTQVLVPLASRQLTAGSFPTKDAAAALVERLKSNGVSCTVVGRR